MMNYIIIIRFVGLDHLVKEYAKIRVLTSEIDEDCPRGFGARYFGTS